MCSCVFLFLGLAIAESQAIASDEKPVLEYAQNQQQRLLHDYFSARASLLNRALVQLRSAPVPNLFMIHQLEQTLNNADLFWANAKDWASQFKGASNFALMKRLKALLRASYGDYLELSRLMPSASSQQEAAEISDRQFKIIEESFLRAAAIDFYLIETEGFQPVTWPLAFITGGLTANLSALTLAYEVAIGQLSVFAGSMLAIGTGVLAVPLVKAADVFRRPMATKLNVLFGLENFYTIFGESNDPLTSLSVEKALGTWVESAARYHRCDLSLLDAPVK